MLFEVQNEAQLEMEASTQASVNAETEEDFLSLDFWFDA